MFFSPLDPIPYPFTGSYEDEKAHSAEVDGWLGLNIAATEAGLQDPRDGAERWLHLPPSTFLTPYTELRRMLELCPLPADSLILDVGAGYGRMGHVIERHFSYRFLGLELVPERVEEGARVLSLQRASRSELRCEDCTQYPLPLADLYFLYDYGSRQAIDLTLGQLRAQVPSRLVRVIGRGRAVRDAIERKHPWLSGVAAPRHFGNFSYYISAED